MGNDVFANGREISCKAADGKAICAFPDVCMTPPENPATPPGVPVPYPNTGMATDTTQGSKTVKISNKEVMLKNKSYFKKSTGDEAGSAAKKGVITSVNRGKVYFNAWSMDVKFEGENVVRHMDLTTHNHASPPGQTPPWLYADTMAFAKSGGDVCEEEKKTAQDACKDSKVSGSGKKAKRTCSKACKKAQQCVLVPKKDDKTACCAPNNTGHHLVEVHCFTATSGRKQGERLKGLSRYDDTDAPCVCASRSRYAGTHGIMHAVQSQLEAAYNAGGEVLTSWPGAGPLVKGAGGTRQPAQSKWTYQQARDAGALAHKTAFPHCNAVCVQNQLDDYHKDKCKLKDETPLRTDPVSRKGGKLSSEQKVAINAEANRIRGLSTSATFA